MKESINEHDMTKKMMQIMRGQKSLINEFVNAPNLNTQTPQGPAPVDTRQADDEDDKDQDTITPKKGDPVFNDELKKLQDTVDPRVNIKFFNIYPSNNNVTIEGTFLQQESEDSGIKFVMDLAAGEIQIPQANVELNDKVSLLLQKLKGYYENWCNEWALKLTNEYKANPNNGTE